MKIAICAILKNENQYLEEWINHYKSIGADEIIFYDNNSDVSVSSFLDNKENISVVEWKDSLYGSQSRAYLHCCRNNKQFDYVGFFDIDEFYMSNNMDIKKDILELKSKYGNFDGLGIYWRIYGQPEPYIETRQAVKDYKYYFSDKHIKSFVNPNKVIIWNDPHRATLENNSIYIDELGRKVFNPTGEHTSENMYIKHIFTRSKEEFKEKIERGDANTRTKNRTWNDFYNYNNLCVLKDG